MKAIRIKTEFLTNPIGVDFKNPLITWNCEGGVKQTAYRIIARTGDATVWDSGRVESDSMRAIYPEPLTSRQIVEYSVTLWDENGNEGEVGRASFEMGLLEADDWKAKWISGNYKVNKKNRYPVDCFKKDFEAKNVKKARLYATSCGLYEARINGERVGNFVLAPGITDYRKRIQYQTYDVTNLIKDGKNVITAELGDGLYRGSCGSWARKNQYGIETKLLIQLEIEDSDGNITAILTDDSWDWTNGGPIRFADNKDGEIVDAGILISYCCKAKLTKCSVLPSASNNVPITEHERLKGRLIATPSGKKVLDFGQNIAGYVEFSVSAKAGQTFHLRFGELINKNGEFDQSNIQLRKGDFVSPKQEIFYTAKDGENHYKTKFAIFGFQYVEISGDIEWMPDDFTAIAVYSDMENTLSFDCSHTLINKLVECTRWSAKNNHADIPTDCPTRERHGWTGDAQIFVTTASYFFDYASFARKFVRIMGDDQRKNGKILQISPYGGVDFYMSYMNGCAGWADAEIIIPYKIWKLYNDERILKENYGKMKKYADYVIWKISKVYPTSLPTGAVGPNKKYTLNYGQAYGEWAEPDDVKAMHWTDFVFTKPEPSTAYGSYVLSLMAEICLCFGDESNASKYRAYSERLKLGYQAIRRGKKYSLDTDRQAELVRPLYFDLFDEEDKKYAQDRLIRALDSYGWRVGTGFLSTPLILYVLQEIGIEYAYRLLENEQMPGWLFMPKMGATTIWEAWEGNSTESRGIASLNHYSKGAVCEWLFSEMCGIKVSDSNTYTVAPRIGGSITYASCEYNGIYGKVKSKWERKDGKVIYSIIVPANTTVRAILQDGEHVLYAGEHELSVNFDTNEVQHNE